MKLLLFDVDGTLTPAKNIITEDMLNCLKKINEDPDNETKIT